MAKIHKSSESSVSSHGSPLPSRSSVRESVPARRVYGMADLQQAAGTSALQHLLRSGEIQGKLATSQSSDPDEVEADRHADAFVSVAVPSPSFNPAGDRNAAASRGTPNVSAALPAGRGAALSANVRRDYEGFFRADLSGVRIHTDNSANLAAQAVMAQAFAHGNNLFFNRGSFDPGSRAGRHLLADELSHFAH